MGTQLPIIKTAVYEGPLELLIELIEKKKLLINDISLSAVTDDYIQHLNSLSEIPVGTTAQFISFAATLLLIKSRSLLPILTLSEKEGRDIQELEYRLAVYQIIRARGIALSKKAGRVVLYAGEPPQQQPVFSPDETLTKENLRSAIQGVMEGFPKNITLPKVEVKKILSLEEAIMKLSQRITSALTLSFKEFTRSGHGKDAPERYEIIVSFLALLELVKQGIIKATQEHNGDIRLESDAIAIPSYE